MHKHGSKNSNSTGYEQAQNGFLERCMCYLSIKIALLIDILPFSDERGKK